MTFIDEVMIKCSCHPTDLIDGDFGALADLSEGELSVVRRTSESHLEDKGHISSDLIFLFFNLRM